MANPKTIKLLVTIPDPGEWCSYVDMGIYRKECPLYDPLAERCLGGKVVPVRETRTKFVYSVRRPQSCKDAEVKA